MSVRDQIRAFVRTALYVPSDTGDDASLVEAGAMDSDGLLEVIAFIEVTYSILVSGRDITPENFSSIAAISDYAERKLSEQRARLQTMDVVARGHQRNEATPWTA